MICVVFFTTFYKIYVIALKQSTLIALRNKLVIAYFLHILSIALRNYLFLQPSYKISFRILHNATFYFIFQSALLRIAI